MMTLQKTLLIYTALFTCAPIIADAAEIDADLDLHDGLTLKSSSPPVKVRVGARFHLDHTLKDGAHVDLDNNLEVRRARLSMRADFAKDWRLSLDYDLANENRRYQSLWLRYRGIDNWQFSLGQFLEPFSLESATSSNRIPFMERSLANTFVPSINLGFAANHWGRNWGISAGVFWESHLEEDNQIESEKGRGITARASYAPIKQPDQVLHLGLSTSARQPEADNQLRFRRYPESRLANNRLVDTRRIRHVDDYVTAGLEIGIEYHNLLAQAEYIRTHVDRSRHYSSEQFDGGYITVSYLLHGKRSRYSARSGAFGEVAQQSKQQAWEIAARYSLLNLNGDIIKGGKQHNTTLGVNWYPLKNTRVMLNYLHSQAEDSRGNDYRPDPEFIQLRLQWAI